jgi:arylsulfatase A-like enzyme
VRLDFALALCSFAAAVPMLVGCRADRRSVPTVLVISIDSLRADHIGAYGYAKPTTPRIDALARSGTLFERALSSTSWTLPAHVALLTGVADSVHGVVDESRTLGPALPTLAERLRARGFATAAVVSGPYLHPRFGLDRGFDRYLNCMGFLDETFEPGPGAGVNIHLDSHGDVTSPCVVRRALEWLGEQGDRPAFVFVHFWDVHYDYHPPAGYAERFEPPYEGHLDPSGFELNPAIHRAMPARDLEHLLALYDGEVLYTDEHVGRLLDGVAALGRRDPYVALTADHGEAFFEHGEKGHQKDLHAEVVRVPLVFSGPGIPAGARRPGPAHITDVTPTLLDLLGFAEPPAARAPGDGWSLAAALREPGALRGRRVASELHVGAARLFALETLEWKIIRAEEPARSVFYDLDADAREQRPLLATAERLAELDRWRGEAARRGASVGALELGPPTDALRERLRSLGYVK